MALPRSLVQAERDRDTCKRYRSGSGSARSIQWPGLLSQEGQCHKQRNNNVTWSRFCDKEYTVDCDTSSSRFVCFSLQIFMQSWGPRSQRLVPDLKDPRRDPEEIYYVASEYVITRSLCCLNVSNPCIYAEIRAIAWILCAPKLWNFYCFRSVQTGSGAHTAARPWLPTVQRLVTDLTTHLLLHWG